MLRDAIAKRFSEGLNSTPVSISVKPQEIVGMYDLVKNYSSKEQAIELREICEKLGTTLLSSYCLTASESSEISDYIHDIREVSEIVSESTNEDRNSTQFYYSYDGAVYCILAGEATNLMIFKKKSMDALGISQDL